MTTTRPQSTTTATAPPTTATAAPPTTTAPRATVAPPTSQQVAAQLAITHETADPGEGFIGSPPVTVSDGAGGYLTAVPALRNPSTDGHGALVFFWHNQTFLGWDTNKETWNVSVRGGGANAIEATYADYAPGEPACCPSLPPVTITYRWNGVGLAQNRTLPAGAIVGIDVTSA
ncbi:MAG: LppP/LprE family lipoprotein [Acidimicrobiales bacterium]